MPFMKMTTLNLLQLKAPRQMLQLKTFHQIKTVTMRKILYPFLQIRLITSSLKHRSKLRLPLFDEEFNIEDGVHTYTAHDHNKYLENLRKNVQDARINRKCHFFHGQKDEDVPDLHNERANIRRVTDFFS
ncbi:hypothetical protein DPMN_099230 [Dreissena polymorpha]|uniref:Uncharacterized protein n=1 Tax=Dreissena polymorpha TaxID=45954 RepID=A0A9D4LF81_DREPO|nr:hypothetical protein DPMN_099230 [Dreissena polymorpha]